MAKKNKSSRGRNGSHHETSPMGHATRTKSREERKRRVARRRKQRGWL